MIRQQLQRDGVQDRGQFAVVLGHADYMHAFAASNSGIGVGKHVQLTTACVDFFDIGLQLLQQLIAWCDGDDRHGFSDQGQGAMLQLAGGIAFGVDVADFFQLQRTFHGNGVMHATAQEQGVFPGPTRPQWR